MNDDGFGGELHAWIEPEIEARLVALILGEASDFEAEELERMMRERPELRIFKRRLEVVHSLMGDAVKPGDDARWRLAPERRAAVMEALGIAAPEEAAVVSIDEGRERRVRRAGLRVAMMAAACLVISVLLAPFLLRGTKSGWASEDMAMEAASYSMPTDGRQMEKESVAQWKRASRPGDEGRMVGRPVSGRGEDRAASSVGEKLAALKENLGSEVTFADETAPADVVVNGALFGRSDADVRELQESKPSSSMARGTRVRSVPAPTARPTPVPVPDVAVPEPSADFGSGDDFGAGWGAGGGGDAFGNGRSSGRAGDVAENAKVESSMGELAARIPPAAPVTGPAAPAEPAPSGQLDGESLALVTPKAESATESLAVLDGKAGEPPVTEGYRGLAAKEDPGVPPVEDSPAMGRLFRQTANSDQSGEAGSVDPFVAEAEHFYDDSGAAPAKEVRLKTKNVEVRQANNEEMEFKWIEEQGWDAGGKPSGGPANRSQGMAADASAQESKNERFLGGGSVGGRAGADRNAADFISPVAGATTPGIPAGADPNGDSVVTGGLRSGDAVVTRNSIDAILNNPTRSEDQPVPPGVMSISGLASEERSKEIQPADMAKAEQKSVERVGFETRPAGVTLESKPVNGGMRGIEEAAGTLDLAVEPEVREFDGFVNEGAPVAGQKRGAVISSGARIELDAEPAKMEKQLQDVPQGMVPTDGERRDSLEGAEQAGRSNGQERLGVTLGASFGDANQEVRMRPRSAQVADADADGLEREEESAVPEDVRKDAASLAWMGQTKGLERQEALRRSGSAEDADKALMDGREAYAEGDYEEAVTRYRHALSKLPGGAMTEGRRQSMEEHLSDGSVALADQYRRMGKYDEARQLLDDALALNAENPHAKKAKAAMDDPVRTNPGMDPGQTQDVDKVRRELYTGEGLYNLGKFDEATKQFEEALRTDPHNQAARRWMERISAAKSDYYRAAYDETRAGLLAEVDKAWEMAVPPEPGEGKDGGVQSGNAAGGAASMTNKLDAIVIPQLDLEGATVEEALDLLRQRTRELDNNEIDPNMKGVNLVLRKARIEGASAVDAELDASAGPGADPGSAVIDDLKLENVTLRQALKEIGDKAGMRMKADEYAVTLLPAGAAEGQDTLTRQWSVPSSFVRDLQRLESADGDEADPFADDGGSTGSALKARKPLAEMLREHGVELPPGASASFLPGSNTLVVKSAPGDLEVVESLVQSIGEGSPPVDYMGLYEPPAPVEEDAAQRAEDLAVADKLRTTIIPMVDFEGTTVEEAVEFLRQRSVELDVAEQGVNFSIQQPQFGFGSGGADAELDAEAGLVARDPGQARIKALKLRNVPLAGVLEYVADQAGLRYQVKDGKVDLVPLGGAEGEDLLTRRWKLHPDVLKELQDEMRAHASDPDDPFAHGEPQVRDSLAQMTVNQKDLIDILKDCGISFPEGTTVMYLPDHQSLVVKNTPSNLDLVDALMAQTAEELARERQSVKTNEKSAAQEAFSTFSLHVSDVSFKLAQAALAKGEWPDPERIRVEEFVNAFDYGDPAPSQDEKVACALEQAAHPFMQQRNLLRISMRTAAVGRSAGTPLRLTVLLDNSGSMERADRVESVKRAFQLLAAQMHPEDEVTLVSFARQPRLLRDSVAGDKVGELVNLIRDTPSEGGTNLEEALRLGLEKAQEDFLEGAQNRIIMLTDGAANLGSADPELLAQLVEQMRQKGIAFDACGVGADGLNDDVLEALTRKGDGRYYFLDRPEDADAGFAKQIAGALRPAAKNVKVQVEFNPKRVGRYRLYGFEKHELKKEDFRNDSVDAAEMAAEEAGVAMYQVETLPDGEGDVGSVSVRFQDMASGEMIEKRWTIPYEASPAVLEDAVPSMKLAASAAFLGEKLKGSPTGELVELGALSGVSRSLQAVYPSNERVGQLIEMIEKAREATR